MKFEVDEKLVEPIIKEQIATAVVSQLGDSAKLIKDMVEMALTEKVSSNGKRSRYSHDNKFSFIDVVAGNLIREAARDALQEVVKEQRPVIQEAIKSELMRAPKKTAASILSAFIGDEQKYRINASFRFSGPE